MHYLQDKPTKNILIIGDYSAEYGSTIALISHASDTTSSLAPMLTVIGYPPQQDNFSQKVNAVILLAPLKKQQLHMLDEIADKQAREENFPPVIVYQPEEILVAENKRDNVRSMRGNLALKNQRYMCARQTLQELLDEKGLHYSVAIGEEQLMEQILSPLAQEQAQRTAISRNSHAADPASMP